MQARDSAVYGRGGQVVQIALPLEASQKFTHITPALDGRELDNPLQLPTDTAKSVMGVEARLAQLEAERSRIMAEGAIAQKGVWIEGFTTVRQRKSGKKVRYEYFHLCTWNSQEKREQKRHLGSAKDSRYLQAREAIWRRDRLEAIDEAIAILKGH
jgi:hypothetical protein